MPQLAQKVLAGDVRATARACRLVDDRAEGHRELLRELAAAGRSAWWIGVTGNPGAGKSTLTDGLVVRFRRDGLRVAVLAVDPTSPFSGGAILGDRIRMQRHFEDSEVFIRSLATRGALGGLSRSTDGVARVLEAWGAQRIVIETVGVGQDELDVARTAHSTLVVVAPGLGDAVQAMKAGIAECADVFAVNKADHSGADAAIADLQTMLALAHESFVAPSRGHSAVAAPRPESACGWTPPIVRTVATRGEGIDDVARALDAHRTWIETTPEGRRRAFGRTRERLQSVLRLAVGEAAILRLGSALTEAVERVERRELPLDDALDELLVRVGLR